MKVYAFAEEGGPLQVPGPLIRVPEGTEIHLTIRNQLPVKAVLHALHAHRGDEKAISELAMLCVRLVIGDASTGCALCWLTSM